MTGLRSFLLLASAYLHACLAAEVPLYGLFETCVKLQKHYENPFDYSQVAVQGTFTSPNGKETVDGFYYQGYSRSEGEGGEEMLMAQGSPQWCVRYSPQQAGVYTVEVIVTDSSGTRMLQNATFTTTQPANRRGFIHRSKNGVHFQFTNGSTYFPVGENVCWVSQKRGTYDYDMYFSKLMEVGANYARLWLTDSGWDDLALEIAVGNFSLPNTWRLDYVVSLAEIKGIYLLMCTESFNYFCTRPNAPCRWDKDSYYNTKFGGFLSHPEDFFTNKRARADYKQRLRYLVARYGYSTSIFAWEFFNEVDITDNYQSSIQVSWNQEMSSYLRSVDIYEHLISTSYSNPDGDTAVQALPSLDFTMTHNYGEQDIALQTAQYPYKKLISYKKPSYVAEFGIGNESQDAIGVSLHNGLWAPLFSLGAGTCMTWWWDSWVEPNNLYPLFQPFSQFVSRLPLATQKSWVRAEAVTSDQCHTWSAQHKGAQCQERSGVQVEVHGCPDGNYASKWYSTASGNVVSSGFQNCTGGKLTDTVQPFTADIAAVYTGD